MRYLLFLDSCNGDEYHICHANILFRETCYNDEMKKYKLVCLDTYLDPLKGNDALSNISHQDSSENDNNNGIEDEDHKSFCFSNVWDCMEFLKKEIGGLNLLRRIEQLAHNFEYSQSSLTRISKLEGDDLFHEYIYVNNLFLKDLEFILCS